MDAMQGDIRGEHIEEMKMVVMRDSVRVSRHLLGVRLTAKTALFSPSSSVAGVDRPKTRLGRREGRKVRFI